MKYKLTFMDDKTAVDFEVTVPPELVTKVIQALLAQDIILTGLVQSD